MGEQYTRLIIGCPACAANNGDMGAPAQFYHAGCGGLMEVSDRANLQCSSCGKSAHVKDWRWGCPNHGDPQREDYFQKSNSTSFAAQMSVAGALTNKMGRKWLMTFLDSLGDW